MTADDQLEPGPLRDWRGVIFTKDDTVIYAKRDHLSTTCECLVLDPKPDPNGRILVQILRRSTADSSWRTVQLQVRVRPDKLTIVGDLPPSPYPTEGDQSDAGRSIAAGRRLAMKGTRRRPRR